MITSRLAGPRSLLPAIALLLAGCGFVAVHTAPAKHAATRRTAAALAADDVFWTTLHAGDYDHIQDALNAETAAYLQDPGDAVTAAHVGWLHIWRVAERSRLEVVPPTITDDILLSQRYFAEAVALDPKDARYRGFLAAATLAAASVNRDEKETRRGYYELRDAIAAWPEFNLFTAGYVMSQQPAGSPRFHEALEWEWRNLDVCIGRPIDRAHPDYSAYLSLTTTTGPKRVCWNSWIAPHNFEGFFLNMGDMLAAAGDWQTARIIYANARLSPTYASWPYRDVLEQRIAATTRRIPPKLMFDEAFSCMACHAATGQGLRKR